MYCKLPHLSNIYCIRHHSYITLLPSLSPTRTFLFFTSTLSYEILFTLYLLVCGSLSYQLWTLWGAIWWLWYLDTWQKKVLKNDSWIEYSVQPGNSTVRFYVRRKDIPLDCRTGYILLCVSAFLICKITSIGKVELIRNHYVTYKAGLKAKNSPWQ